MKKVYIVTDSASKSSYTPFFMNTHDEMFRYIIAHFPKAYLQDLTVYLVGAYDYSRSEFLLNNERDRIATGVDLLDYYNETMEITPDLTKSNKVG
jgi:hypothetical protein